MRKHVIPSEARDLAVAMHAFLNRTRINEANMVEPYPNLFRAHGRSLVVCATRDDTEFFT
jgi:hypothetical protein